MSLIVSTKNLFTKLTFHQTKFLRSKGGQTKMLDSSDIRNAVLELKKSILFVNRYEKAADATAAIIGKSASLQSRPLLSDLPQDAAELACESVNWLSCMAS